MKKITILVIIALLLLIFINPSKVGIINTLNASAETVKEIINIDLEGELKYINYNGLLCVLNNGKLSAVNENGKEIFSKDIPVENVKLSSDNYIDVLNKNSNKIYSIDDKGEIIFSSETSKDGFLYKSINEYVFVDVIKSNDKEVIKILNESGWVSKKITIEGKVTGVNNIDDSILVSYISITDKVYNNLVIYDSNGNLKSQSKFEGVILDTIVMNDSIYLVFENKINILDKKLNTKIHIDAKDIISISNSKDKIFIEDSEGNIGYIQDNEYNRINTKEKNVSIEPMEGTYILYSDKTIYNDKLKEIITFEDEIMDIEHINGKNIAVIFDRYIKIFNIE